MSHRAGWVPHVPHAIVSLVPGVQGPSAVHAPYCQWCVASQKRSAVPQRPQGVVSVAPAVAQASSVHVPLPSSMQLAEQSASRVCPAGQSLAVRTVVPGTHAPSPEHVAPGAVCHAHEVSQICVMLPHIPHGPLRVSPGEHAPASASQVP